MVRISDKPMMIYFVFKETEVVYIGQTQMNLSQRKGKHVSEARLGRGSVLGAAIRKHGEDKFEFKKHSLVFNQEDADKNEKHYIEKYRPKYNVQEGRKERLRETAVPFICHQNGKMYWCKSDAGEDLGIDAQNIRNVLSTAHPMKSHKGYTFSYVSS